MEWPPEIRSAHLGLSAVDWRFRERAAASPELLRRANFRTIQELPRVEDAVIQPWPAFVDRRRVRHLAEVSIGLKRLIGSIPQRIFGNDPDKIREYYGLDSARQAEIMIASPNCIAEGLARGDFILGASGWQCIEFNIAGNLGGWHTGVIAEKLLRVPVFAGFVRDLDASLSVTNTVRALFSYVARRARAVAPGDAEVNVVMGVADDFILEDHLALRRYAKAEYGAALRELGADLDGSLVFSHYGDLTLEEDRLYYRGRRIHAVIESHMDRTAEITATAFKAGKLHLYNGPISPLLTDKRNLALLSEAGESARFDDADRDLIKKHVPWTRTIADREDRYRGERRPLSDLLIAHRRRLVIKKASSFQGLDVAIGSSTPESAWREAVERAFEEGDWIAQERVESLPFLFQEGDYGCAPHDVIWGPFVFGDTYGGTILKMKPKAQEGVVNVAQGATRGILFELG